MKLNKFNTYVLNVAVY